MQVSPIDKTKKATIVSDLEDVVQTFSKKLVYTEDQVDLIKAGRSRHGLTFSAASRLILEREGPTGFLRGLAPSCLRGTLSAGSYLSMLYTIE